MWGVMMCVVMHCGRTVFRCDELEVLHRRSRDALVKIELKGARLGVALWWFVQKRDESLNVELSYIAQINIEIAETATHEEWKDQPAQFECARQDLVAKVREILDRS